MAAAGFVFEVCVPDIDERLRSGETPRGYVRRLASEKAVAASKMLMGPSTRGPAQPGPDDSDDEPNEVDDNRAAASDPVRAAVSGFSRTAASAGRTRHGADDVLILAADTAVVVDDEILGKPVDRADAERMLRRLSGREHRVMTGVSVRFASRQVETVEETAVFVRMLTDADVAWYVDSGEGQGKAGGYAIQGLASRFVPRIEGSYSNVVGLPVARVDELINELIKGVE
jgi:septum formation protein